MDHLLNVTTGLSIVLIVIVLVSVRRAHIRVEYSVSWLVAACAMLVLSQARPVLDAVRRTIGLPDTPLTLFLLGGGVLLIMFFRFSVIISHLRDDNIALAQRVAILEYHLRSLGNHENKKREVRKTVVAPGPGGTRRAPPRGPGFWGWRARWWRCSGPTRRRCTASFCSTTTLFPSRCRTPRLRCAPGSARSVRCSCSPIGSTRAFRRKTRTRITS